MKRILYFQLLEADKIRHKSEKDHKQAALAYRELEERATRLAKQLKRVVNKARSVSLVQVILAGTLTGVQGNIRCKVLAALSTVK